jgi:hypothetical protein
MPLAKIDGLLTILEFAVKLRFAECNVSKVWDYFFPNSTSLRFRTSFEVRTS